MLKISKEIWILVTPIYKYGHCSHFDICLPDNQTFIKIIACCISFLLTDIQLVEPNNQNKIEFNELFKTLLNTT